MRFPKGSACVVPAALALVFSFSLAAAPISSCASDLSSCNVYEGQLVTFPSGYYGYAGDVIVRDPATVTVDVFRVFNNLVDTGGGTGLGTVAFLYAADLNDLPNSSTYSFNSVTVSRGTAGPTGYYETDYDGNGTLYRLLTPAPEPSVLALLVLGTLAIGTFALKRRRVSAPDRSPAWHA